MNFKKIMITAVTILSGLVLTACSSSSTSSLESIKSKGKLVVATSPDYAPFEFQTLVDGKNKVVGSDIELAQAIADELGVELEISSMSFDNVLASVQSGKADLAISGLTKTKEREAVFDFSEAYYESSVSVVVRKADLEKYTSADSLAEKSVGTQKGSIPEKLAKEQLSKSSLVSLASVSSLVNQLQSGKVEAVTMDEPVALNYVAQNDDLAIAKLSLKTTEGESNAVALKKGDTELKAAVDKVIKKLNADGTYKTYLENASKLTVSK